MADKQEPTHRLIYMKIERHGWYWCVETPEGVRVSPQLPDREACEAWLAERVAR